MKSTIILRRTAITIFLVLLLLPTLAAAADRDADGYPRLMQGPMVGAVSPNTAMIWLRTTGEYEISVQYATDFEMASAQTSEPVVARKANDYVVVVTLEGLAPAT